MVSYQDKEALKKAIIESYEKYSAEFTEIPEALKDKIVPEVKRSPAENLAYQVGWTTLLLQWEAEEKAGKEVLTPSADFKWNQLGELYEWFNARYASQSLEALSEQLNQNVQAILSWIDGLTEEELFAPHQRAWADGATKKAIWPVYRFIHVNTVAPFKTFRTQIRKWKKLSLTK